MQGVCRCAASVAASPRLRPCPRQWRVVSLSRLSSVRGWSRARGLRDQCRGAEQPRPANTAHLMIHRLIENKYQLGGRRTFGINNRESNKEYLHYTSTHLDKEHMLLLQFKTTILLHLYTTYSG